VELHRLTASETIDRIMSELEAGRGGWVVTPNLTILHRLVHDPAYANLCAQATLRVADGMPLIWASRLQGTPLPERVAGSDLIWTLSERAAPAGKSVFLLGGSPGTADQAADRLRSRFPGLMVAGIECPPFGFENDAAYMSGMIDRVVRAAPDICYVGLVSAKQDPLICRLRPLLPRTWFLGIGVSFSFVSGTIVRAPRWARAVGLEWLFRLLQELRRLGRRYLIEGVPFAARLMVQSALARGSARA
jgi:N-acetylglucosaminyldiphosphoundecaprenol N-acetyl-beta-D-mannosaminyltransferase